MRLWIGAAASALTMMTAGAAWSAPSLSQTPYSPVVTSGETSVEVRGGRSFGKASDGDTGAIVELEHGFDQGFSASLVAEFEKHPSERSKLDSVGVEVIVPTGVLPLWDIETGVYAEYEQRLHNESGVGEVKALFMKREGPFEGRLNLVATHPFSRNDHVTEFDYIASADWRVKGPVRLGVQALGEIGHDGHFGGRLEHYIGPAAKTVVNFPYVGVKLQAAYLVPVGPARRGTDGQFRFGVELEKRW